MHDDTRLSQRYGRSRGTGRPAPAAAAAEDERPEPLAKRLRALLGTTRGKAAAAVLLLAVGGAGWVAYDQSVSRVTSKDLAYAFPQRGQARVEFTVTKQPRTPAQCAVQVLDEQHAVVGWKVVDIPPSGQGRTTQHTVELRTVSPGVSAGVGACWKTS